MAEKGTKMVEIRDKSDEELTTGLDRAKDELFRLKLAKKTVVVQVTRRVKDVMFHKYMTKRERYKAHDEKNEYKIGDRVEIVETRPTSKDKRWRVAKLIERPQEV